LNIQVIISEYYTSFVVATSLLTV